MVDVMETSATPAVTAAYRQVFGHLPTAVTVIAAREAASDGAPGPVAGLVVGTFSSLSLDPPLVSFSVMNTSRAWARLRAVGTFTASILASDQSALCTSLSGRDPRRFDRVAFAEDADLVVAGCVAWVTCGISQVVEAGDHSIVIASASDLQLARPEARPLVFYRRAYHRTLQVEDFPAPGWW